MEDIRRKRASSTTSNESFVIIQAQNVLLSTSDSVDPAFDSSDSELYGCGESESCSVVGSTEEHLSSSFEDIGKDVNLDKGCHTTTTSFQPSSATSSSSEQPESSDATVASLGNVTILAPTNQECTSPRPADSSAAESNSRSGRNIVHDTMIPSNPIPASYSLPHSELPNPSAFSHPKVSRATRLPSTMCESNIDDRLVLDENYGPTSQSHRTIIRELVAQVETYENKLAESETALEQMREKVRSLDLALSQASITPLPPSTSFDASTTPLLPSRDALPTFTILATSELEAVAEDNELLLGELQALCKIAEKTQARLARVRNAKFQETRQGSLDRGVKGLTDKMREARDVNERAVLEEANESFHEALKAKVNISSDNDIMGAFPEPDPARYFRATIDPDNSTIISIPFANSEGLSLAPSQNNSDHGHDVASVERLELNTSVNATTLPSSSLDPEASVTSYSRDAGPVLGTGGKITVDFTAEMADSDSPSATGKMTGYRDDSLPKMALESDSFLGSTTGKDDDETVAKVQQTQEAGLGGIEFNKLNMHPGSTCRVSPPTSTLMEQQSSSSPLPEVTNSSLTPSPTAVVSKHHDAQKLAKKARKKLATKAKKAAIQARVELPQSDGTSHPPVNSFDNVHQSSSPTQTPSFVTPLHEASAFFPCSCPSTMNDIRRECASSMSYDQSYVIVEAQDAALSVLEFADPGFNLSKSETDGGEGSESCPVVCSTEERAFSEFSFEDIGRDSDLANDPDNQVTSHDGARQFQSCPAMQSLVSKQPDEKGDLPSDGAPAPLFPSSPPAHHIATLEYKSHDDEKSATSPPLHVSIMPQLQDTEAMPLLTSSSPHPQLASAPRSQNLTREEGFGAGVIDHQKYGVISLQSSLATGELAELRDDWLLSAPEMARSPHGLQAYSDILEMESLEAVKSSEAQNMDGETTVLGSLAEVSRNGQPSSMMVATSLIHPPSSTSHEVTRKAAKNAQKKLAKKPKEAAAPATEASVDVPHNASAKYDQLELGSEAEIMSSSFENIASNSNLDDSADIVVVSPTCVSNSASISAASNDGPFDEQLVLKTESQLHASSLDAYFGPTIVGARLPELDLEPLSTASSVADHFSTPPQAEALPKNSERAISIPYNVSTSSSLHIIQEVPFAPKSLKGAKKDEQNKLNSYLTRNRNLQALKFRLVAATKAEANSESARKLEAEVKAYKQRVAESEVAWDVARRTVLSVNSTLASLSSLSTDNELEKLANGNIGMLTSLKKLRHNVEVAEAKLAHPPSKKKSKNFHKSKIYEKLKNEARNEKNLLAYRIQDARYQRSQAEATSHSTKLTTSDDLSFHLPSPVTLSIVAPNHLRSLVESAEKMEKKNLVPTFQKWCRHLNQARMMLTSASTELDRKEWTKHLENANRKIAYRQRRARELGVDLGAVPNPVSLQSNVVN